jgi:hypothetical protein
MYRHAASAVYPLAQGLGALGWWIVLWRWPCARAYFKANSAPDSTLLAFLLPDLVVLIAGSLVGAYAIATRQRWELPAMYVLAGASIYAALYCWGLTIATGGEGLLGAVLMSPLLVAPAIIAVAYQSQSAAP